METNTFVGAILLLNHTPDDDVLSNIVRDVTESQFPGMSVHHYISRTLPESTPVHIYDQYTAEVRDLGDDAVFLVIEPN